MSYPEKLVSRRMSALGIREEDLAESFIRSGGPGGQNVNKVSTCVWLKHLPSGIEVKCQKERSQAANRDRARLILCQKLEERLLRQEECRRQALEKLRRQKRGRCRQAKNRLRQEKLRISARKRSRQKVRDFDE